MKIETKLILSNVMYGAFIILIGFFAFQNMSLVLTKLRFVEIADDLNASFLEMRLSEKNYFLYHDDEALGDIRDKIASTMKTIEAEKKNIIPAIGEEDFLILETYLNAYADAVLKARGVDHPDRELELKIRGY